MKNSFLKIILTGGMVMASFFLLYQPAHADLQCYEAPSFTASVSVQNASACASFSPGSMLYDTSAKTWTNPRTGQTVNSPTDVASDPQQTSSNQVYADCMSKSGATADACQQSATQQTGVPPTNTTITPGQTTDALGNPINNPAAPAAPATPAATTPPTPATTGCPNGGTMVNGACNLGYTPLEPIPGVTVGANNSQLDFPTLLGNIYKIAIIIGALFSVLMLTVSGVRYMLSDIVTDKDRAKKRIRACLYGLVLIAASWLILNTINPQLVIFNLNPGTATVSPGAPTVPQTTGAPTQIAQLTSQQASTFPTGVLANNEAILYTGTTPDPQLANKANADCQASQGTLTGAPLGINGQSAMVCMNPNSPNYTIYNGGAAQP